MNELNIDIDDFTSEEILQFIDEVNDEYENWNINFASLTDNLSVGNKIFLATMNEKVGEKIFYMIHGYLTSETLVDYDEMTGGGISEFIKELSNEDTLNFIEMLIDFKKQEVELIEDEVDFEKIIAKLKRDVATLKKKLSQPSKYINTKQFKERYGLTQIQQKRLRGNTTNPLPYTMLNRKTFLYDPDEVDKWLENYKGRMKIEDI